MKTLLILASFLFVSSLSFGQAEFDVEPNQSMCMTGKGPGQDATINPFAGQACYAIVSNIGKRPFSARIQEGDKITQEITIAKGENAKILLSKSAQLFLDPITDEIAKARVEYEAIKK